MKYVNPQFVRWDDIDAFGHVNNAKYLTFIQEARFLWSVEASKEKGFDPTILEMVVARAEVDFISPIYDGGRTYDIHLWVENIGNSSFTLKYEIVGDNNLVHAKVTTVQVAVSLETKKSRPLTDTEKQFLELYKA